MAQLTLRLSDDLNRALQAAAAKSQRKSSEIVRIALREFLGLERGVARPADRVRSLLGSVESGVSDLATRHRDYVVESIRRGR